MDMNIDMDDPTLMNTTFDLPTVDFGLQDQPLPLDDNFFSQELLELGLDEPLPPQDMINELCVIFSIADKMKC